MITRKLVFCGAVLLFSGGMFSGGMSVVRAQGTSAIASGSQPTSLGDAARKARAQKKPSGKPAKVFTNDDMGRLKHTHSVIKSPSTPASLTTDKKPSQ
jgi:hypothetical protein